jgi:hypothetical protein
MHAHQIEEKLCQLAGELRPAVASEVRKYLAIALEGVASEPLSHDPLAPGGAPPEFEDEDSFLAGIRWAAALVADQNFDF